MRISRIRVAALSAALLTVAVAPVSAADGPKSAPARPRLNPLDLGRLWQATSPALLAGREPELLEQIRSNFSTAPQAPNQPRGWYHPSILRYDWDWLAARSDRDRDGSILRVEFTGPDAAWDVLDRDNDGVIAPTDFDWSERSTWYQMARQGSRRFDLIDADGNGQITPQEWEGFFAVAARGKGHLTNDDLRDAMFTIPDRPRSRLATFADRVDRLKVILNGDIGSMFEGPELNGPAPDFNLPAHDGQGAVMLSEHRGKRPVVLIFGSFT